MVGVYALLDGWKPKDEGCAPRVKLLSTNEKALEIIEIEKLKKHQIDLN